jgi:type II secretory pathway predicted ATPase ExeA
MSEVPPATVWPSDDPFFLVAPIRPDTYVRVQPDEIAALKQAISNGRVAVVTGPLGIGKTSLCRYIVDELMNESLSTDDVSKQIVPVYLSGAAYRETDDFLKGIIKGLALDSNRDRVALFSILTSWPREHKEKLAAVIDDASESGANVDELGEFLRALADVENIAIVLNGEPKRMKRFLDLNPPLRDRIQTIIELRQMTRYELKEMLTKRAKTHDVEDYVSEGAYDELYKLSKGVPRVALKAASRAFELARKEGKNIDRTIVKRANQVSFWERLFPFLRKKRSKLLQM